MKRIFLGTPITSILHNDNKDECEKDLKSIRSIFNSLNDIEHIEAVCALDREEWGKNPMKGEVCTELDYLEMKRCDVYVTFPIKSHGVSVELGWGSSLKKKIIILINTEHQFLTPLYFGLFKLKDTKIIEYKSYTNFTSMNDWRERILPEILSFID